MGRRFWIGLLLVSCVGAAGASGPGAVRKQVESSLLVKGTIDLHADGSVAGYALDNPGAVPEGIAALIADAVPLWRFEPVEISGGATRARATMSMRLVAKKMEGGDFTVQIRGAQFFGQERPGESVGSVKLVPPAYPAAAARSGVGGTVYTVVKIGRDGRVADAVAEQVNLRIIASESDMGRWRDLLAKAALRAVKHWTFRPPTLGDEVDAPYWSARVPVDFVAPDQRLPKDGQWQAYVPGPRQDIPWTSDDSDAGGADALAADGVYPVGGGPRLLTALTTP
ncbi:MAG: energy transducer TonB [Lysobacter sp.]